MNPRRSPEAPTAYWLQASADELHHLLRGEVSELLLRQAIKLLKREPYESTAMYAARLRDLSDQDGAP